LPRTLREAEIEAFRARLCAAATRLFAERGIEGATMRALAAELGCSPMTPYRYFGSKEQILAAVRESAFERFGEACRRAVEGVGDPCQRVRVLARAYVDFARREPDAYRVMFQLDRPGPLGPPPKPGGWSVLLGTLEEAVATGRLAGDPQTLAHLAWVSLHGVVTLHFADRLNLGRSLDELVEATTDHFLRGAAPHLAGERPSGVTP